MTVEEKDDENENADRRMRPALMSDGENAFEVLMRSGRTSAVRRRCIGTDTHEEKRRRRLRNDISSSDVDDDDDGRSTVRAACKGERELVGADLEAAGVDVAFLDALPPELRAEVLATQVVRLAANHRRRRSSSTLSTAVGASKVAAPTQMPAACRRQDAEVDTTLPAGKEQSELPCRGTNAFALLMERRDAEANKALPGNHIIEEFITQAEENEIVGRLDADMRNPWKLWTFSGRYFGKRYGVRVEYGPRRMVLPSEFGMPSWLSAIVVRIEEAVKRLTGEDFAINECNAIDYRRSEGHWLSPHVDDRQSSTSIIVNLSLVGAASMTYVSERKRATERICVPLQPRALQIQSGSCRYDFTHSIENCNLYAPRRVSITFRESPL